MVHRAWLRTLTRLRTGLHGQPEGHPDTMPMTTSTTQHLLSGRGPHEEFILRHVDRPGAKIMGHSPSSRQRGQVGDQSSQRCYMSTLMFDRSRAVLMGRACSRQRGQRKRQSALRCSWAGLAAGLQSSQLACSVGKNMGRSPSRRQ